MHPLQEEEGLVDQPSRDLAMAALDGATPLHFAAAGAGLDQVCT